MATDDSDIDDNNNESTSIFSLTKIQQARELLVQSNQCVPESNEWILIQENLIDLIETMLIPPDPNKEMRLKLFECGIYSVCFPIVNAPPGKHRPDLVDYCYILLSRSMEVPSVSDKDNLETLTKGVELGLIELAIKEMQYRPLRGPTVNRAMLCLSTTASKEEFASRIVRGGAVQACLNLIRDTNVNDGSEMGSCTSRALNILASLAAVRPTSLFGIDEQGIKNTLYPLLPLLNHYQHNMIMTGFRSARLLIRLFGKECGIIIRENPDILTFYPHLMKLLLESGGRNKRFCVFNSYWRLGGVALDLWLISIGLNQEEKSLLVPICPLMMEMLTLYGQQESNLLRYGMIFLSQVLDNQQCLMSIRNFKDSFLSMIQDVILSDGNSHVEIICVLKDVVGVVG
jgi:hypothetical protein